MPLLLKPKNYAQLHFQDEEQIMASAGYPKLDQHHTIHESLIDTIFQLHQSFVDGNLHLELETMRFVRSWLPEHILENNYQFRDYLRHKKNS